NTSAYQDVSVTVNGEYAYRVRAFNNVASSGLTGTATANTILPADPTNIASTTISSTQIQITWTDAATNEDGYRIERCVGASCSDFTLLVALGPGTTLHNDNTVTIGNSYTYRVLAYNVAGNSSFTSN